MIDSAARLPAQFLSTMRNITNAPGLFCLGLTICLAGCKAPIIVSDYAQAQLLADDYTKHYTPNKKTRGWYGPAPAISPLRRIHPQQPAIVVGHVVRLEADATTTPQPGASVILKYKELAATDENGAYVLSLPPGTHTVTAGAIGFLKSKPISFKLQAGDSIQLNFRLMSDLRPIIHTMP
jgi:hypothetical protein